MEGTKSMEIKVYSTPNCPWCKKLKDWLKSKKLAFQDIDVTESGTARDEMIEKSGQMGVPVILIKNTDKEEVVVGFTEAKLDAAIKKIS